jgi:hypothetical protein
MQSSGRHVGNAPAFTAIIYDSATACCNSLSGASRIIWGRLTTLLRLPRSLERPLFEGRITNSRSAIGQIPTYEEGDLALFETGAIVFHIAERHAGLLPDDANARARAITWMFAALNTVEPPILERETARLLEGDKTWYEERVPLVCPRMRSFSSVLQRRRRSGPVRTSPRTSRALL